METLAVRGGNTWHACGVLVWRSLAEVPAQVGPSVVTIGNFDGVHRGHLAVLSQVVAQAGDREALAVAVTFEPHPLQVLHPEVAPDLVTGPDQRLELLEAAGIDAVLVHTFDAALAAQTPERYVRDVFVETLGAVAVVIGVDIRFGVRNSGDLTTLRELGEVHGFEVVALQDVTGTVTSAAGGTTCGAGGTGGGTGADPRRWSSSWVRRLLAEGDVRTAADVLGRLHRLDGVVVHGDHRGRELGYPTANLSQDAQGLVPADGVYAGWLVAEPGALAPTRYPAAVSIGTNPQFDGVERRVEAYVLDRDDLQLYGVPVRVELVERLRGTARFESVDHLVAQMAVDVEHARSVLLG